MATEKEIYLMAMSQTGKALRDLTDDDILAAVGTYNAIARSKDNSMADHTRLKRKIWDAQYKYHLLPNDEEKEINQTVRLIRRRAGLE